MPILREISIQIRTSITICILLAAQIHAHTAAATGFDVITMQNGDIHIGTAALETFSITTADGRVSIPYLSMQKINIGNTASRDEIYTRFGERFSGEISDTEIMALRHSGPALPLAVADIASIEFSPQQQATPDNAPPDGIELTNGDRFSGRILSGDYLVKGKTSIHIFQRDDINIIDISSVADQPGSQVQLTSNNGEIVQGQLVSTSIRARTRYGQTLSLPLAGLSLLAFNLGHLAAASDFHFRRTIEPSSLIQDHMVDGTPAPVMAILPGGQYLRGDLQGNGDEDERPPVTMQIKPFAIGLYEITFNQYQMFCIDTGRELPDDQEWGRNRRPAINVSWEDATAYSQWLSRKTGYNYRLPSDAEWEYAARGNSKTRYWWGQLVDRPRANCEGCGSIWDGEKSSPVGRFLPNGFGLHDTAGNVFEWVADCLHDDFSQDPKDGTPVDRKACGKRIIRGGAWSFLPKEIRSANRWRDFPTRRSDDTGFRVARDLR